MADAVAAERLNHFMLELARSPGWARGVVGSLGLPGACELLEARGPVGAAAALVDGGADMPESIRSTAVALAGDANG